MYKEEITLKNFYILLYYIEGSNGIYLCVYMMIYNIHIYKIYMYISIYMSRKNFICFIYAD